MSPHKVGIMSQLESNDFSTRATHHEVCQKSQKKGEISVCNMMGMLKKDNTKQRQPNMLGSGNAVHDWLIASKEEI